ncbi:MAG: three-Cys-motif partner protein TcmP [bacterium]
MKEAKLDIIGNWSEDKLEILKKYSEAYVKIVGSRFKNIYVDAFAGAGEHISKETGDRVPGSPLNALNVKIPFKEYHFIDTNKEKVELLRKLSKEKKNVYVYCGDCNKKLLEEVFPRIKYSEYCRGLCLLDPYGLHLDWQVIKTAGEMKSIEIFLNFPVMDINMNALKKNPDKVTAEQALRMTRFWGDETWKEVAYSNNGYLFEELKEKINNKNLAEKFRERLIKVAGFKIVPQPIAMKNSTGSIIYYLFFASQEQVAGRIVKDIFKSYTKI